MKLGDKVKLDIPRKPIRTAIITKIHPESKLNLNITWPGGTTQNFFQIERKPKDKNLILSNIPYWFIQQNKPAPKIIKKPSFTEIVKKKIDKEKKQK